MKKSADLPPPPDDYFLEIESSFASRRGTPFVFSARDWDLIRRWKEAGIPLPIVLEAINGCFDQKEKAPRRRTISSLSYCRRAVEELWDERRDLQIGAEGGLPELSLDEGLRELRKGLASLAEGTQHEPLGRKLRDAERRIASIRGKTVPEIEQELMAIEEDLVEGLEAVVPSETMRLISERLERSIEGVEFRDEATRERTRAANLRRILRAELGLPRLSLLG